MKVSGVSYAQPLHKGYSGNYVSNAKFNEVKNDSFQPAFKGFERTLQQAVKNILENDVEVEKTFSNLFKEATNTEGFTKTSEYYGIADEYYKHGFRGLLYELWKSTPQPALKKYLQNDVVDLVKKDNKPIFQLVHFYKFGFSKNSPNDVKLVFMNPKNETSIEYSLNKKGELHVWQTDKNKSVITTYHLTTGSKKCTVEHNYDCSPETTYYNKDGSKAFFKNFLWGGVAISPK